MKVAYVDTSCLVAVAFGEPRAKRLADRLDGYDLLASSNLLEAEFASALKREGVRGGRTPVDGMSWVLPDRRLSAEIDRVLAAGYVRGADLWHLATALYLAESPADLDFVTLDAAQQEIASALGFPAPDWT